jgi:hypothetical protein
LNKEAVAYLKVLPGICLEEERKTAENSVMTGNFFAEVCTQQIQNISSSVCHLTPHSATAM